MNIYLFNYLFIYLMKNPLFINSLLQNIRFLYLDRQILKRNHR